MVYTAVPEEDTKKIKELNDYYQKVKAEEERVKKALGQLIYKIEEKR